MLTTAQRLSMLEPPTSPVDLVIDTDAYNEIDDQFAIAYALRNPEKLHVQALYAAPFLNHRSVSAEDGMVKSEAEIHRLLALMGEDRPVFSGSRTYLPDEMTPVISPAAEDLARRAMAYSPEKPLYVAALGAITNDNIDHYSDLIAEDGDGGADLIISATGWIGHTAFIDPNTKKFAADTLEEFMQLPAGFVDNHRLTIVQNSGAFGSGDLYHTPRYSVSIGPRDVMYARDHLERHDLGFMGGYSSWERMISRLQLYGPVCKEVPASLFQLTKGTIYVSEEMARPIEPMDLIAF